MSFKATFKVDGKEYRVLNLSYSLHQEIDSFGRPASTTRGGVVDLTVESTDNTSLFELMCDSYGRKDCSVIFNKRDEDSKMKELELTEAYIIGYNETFDNEGAGAMTETITLSSKSIKMGNGEHENDWPI
jgi:hypothetical protein